MVNDNVFSDFISLSLFFFNIPRWIRPGEGNKKKICAIYPGTGVICALTDEETFLSALNDRI